MLLINHVLSGALTGALARRPVAAFTIGAASHFVLDAVPHWGDWGSRRRFLRVAVADGLASLAAMGAFAALTPSGRRMAVVAGMAGAALPDIDKPTTLWFGWSPWPSAVNRFHSGIQRESAGRAPVEVLAGCAFAAAALTAIRGSRRPRVARAARAARLPACPFRPNEPWFPARPGCSRPGAGGTVATRPADRWPCAWGPEPLEETDMYQPDTVPGVLSTELPAGAFLLDVREDDEWAAGHAPDAVHVRLGDLGARAGELPRDREVYVICRTGTRSGYAAQALAGGGLNAVNVADGMTGWAVAGRPMVSEDGAEPYVA